MNRLVSVSDPKAITKYLNTPVGLLLEYHNLNRKFDHYQQARILIGMCMDNRITLRLPPNFAYILRTGGANLQFCDFYISYTVAIGNIPVLALLGHNDCGMAKLSRIQERFVRGLVDNAGWTLQAAREYFFKEAPKYEIKDEITFTLQEAIRLRSKYPKITIVPLFYRMEDHLLYLIQE